MRKTLAELTDWTASFMSQASNEKLVILGWRTHGFLISRFRPDYWPKFTGSSRQRRIKRRWFARMWKEIGEVDHSPSVPRKRGVW